MRLLTWIIKIISVSLVVLFGNWIGGILHYILIGDKVQTIQFEYTTAKGRQIKNSPVATKFYPGLMFSFLGKPRWFFAFLGGVLAGGLVPDRLEHVWLERVIEPVFVDRVMGVHDSSRTT